MHEPDLPHVIEPRDAAEARMAMDDWLAEWHKQHPGQLHPLDLDPNEWADTQPAELKD